MVFLFVWSYLQTIPGKEDAAISSLVWCKSRDVGVSPLGRLFSAGLDGFITEWDLVTLQPKVRFESAILHNSAVLSESGDEYVNGLN